MIPGRVSVVAGTGCFAIGNTTVFVTSDPGLPRHRHPVSFFYGCQQLFIVDGKIKHVKLPNRHLDLPDRTNASGECLQAYSDHMCYTVAKQDQEFIHQHVVDTVAAQHSGGPTRNITVAFGLIGLYLALKKG